MEEVLGAVRGTASSLAPPTGSPKKDVEFFWVSLGELSSAARLRESPHYKMQGFDNGSSLHLCEKELDVTRRRE